MSESEKSRGLPGTAGGAASRLKRSGFPRSAARLAAIQALYQIESTEAPPEEVLEEFLHFRLQEVIEGVRLDELDQVFFAELVENVCHEAPRLDDMLSAVLAEGWPVERLESLLRLILRAGAYELAYLPEIPARVVIAEYVDLAHAFFGGKEPGMANGVLDRLARHLRAEEFEPDGPLPEAPDAA